MHMTEGEVALHVIRAVQPGRERHDCSPPRITFHRLSMCHRAGDVFDTSGFNTHFASTRLSRAGREVLGGGVPHDIAPDHVRRVPGDDFLDIFDAPRCCTRYSGPVLRGPRLPPPCPGLDVLESHLHEVRELSHCVARGFVVRGLFKIRELLNSHR